MLCNKFSRDASCALILISTFLLQNVTDAGKSWAEIWFGEMFCFEQLVTNYIKKKHRY